jgi:hypothetical protein
MQRIMTHFLQIHEIFLDLQKSRYLCALKRHHMVHFGANAYPFSELVVVVAGDMGQHFFAGSQAQGVYGRA